jgi:methyltransferase (TIGR00027 family)
MEQQVEDIGDTARWVAMYRALETDRPDALFRDVHARRLAGEGGQALLDKLRGGRQAAWAVVVRTAVLDEMILYEVSKGVDCVVNLAAGLDTRPYRLGLPATLRWVEVDHAPMVTHKEAMLAGERPSCELVRYGCDLADVKARRGLFARMTGGCQKVLVVAEGLLIYLRPSDVELLARDVREVPHVKGFVFDNYGSAVLGVLRRAWGEALGSAELRFAVDDLKDFFLSIGWRVGEYRGTVGEALRLRREPPFGLVVRGLSLVAWPGAKERIRKLSGIAVLRPA